VKRQVRERPVLLGQVPGVGGLARSWRAHMPVLVAGRRAKREWREARSGTRVTTTTIETDVSHKSPFESASGRSCVREASWPGSTRESGRLGRSVTRMPSKACSASSNKAQCSTCHAQTQCKRLEIVRTPLLGGLEILTIPSRSRARIVSRRLKPIGSAVLKPTALQFSAVARRLQPARGVCPDVERCASMS
jgi:hypothetical protein